MKITELNKLPENTLVFCGYNVLSLKFNRSHNGEAYGHTDMFTTPEEYFARYPEAQFANVCQMQGGEFVHGVATFNKGGYANEWGLTGKIEQLKAQRAQAEADGSMTTARAMVAATAAAESLPVVTADTHAPVPNENFRRWNKGSLPAIVQAKRRAVELGYKAVILHNLPGEKYGMRWSPAQPK